MIPGAVTVTGSDGKPMQIPQALVAQAQMGMVHPGPGATITVQGADGKPMQIPSNVLPMAQGRVLIKALIAIIHKHPRIVNSTAP